MSKILKRIFASTIYFLFWIILYTIFYGVVYYAEEVILLPRFRLSHKLAVAFIAFIKYLPALEIAAIVILFTISVARRSHFQLKRHSDVVISVITKLFSMCILASFINITMSEVVRPILVDIKNYDEILSQKYYENINNASIALEKENYADAEQYVNMALLIWEDNREALSLKERIAGSVTSKIQDINESKGSSVASYFITLPESLNAKEILSMAKTRINMLDFYTASYYINLVLHLEKDDEDFKKEANKLLEQCIGKIDSGFSNENTLKAQEEFEAKKNAYDALIQKDYIKAYYSFLRIHNDLLRDGNKYDPDVEKYLAIAKNELSEHTFFIEELNDIQTFNSSYPIHFSLKNKNVRFNVAGFYFHTKKDHFDIHFSNVIYSTYNSDGSLISQVVFPYTKVIEKKVDGKSRLYMLVSAISEKEQPKQNFAPPIDLEMTLEDFNLILLAQKGAKAMSIGDLYQFIPIADNYGFDGYIYQTELSMRFADFFLFIIFTVFLSILAFNLRPTSIDKCTLLLLLACLIFSYPIYILFEIMRYVFKLLMTLLNNSGIIFPNIIAMILLLCILIASTYLLYNIGYEEKEN